jgi:predicted DNA-binding transcriptional regulator YafY
MTRTDRLMAIILLLQGRRVVRAQELATQFEVSIRTVYRDMDALGEAGVPIAAEAGVGYSLVKGYHVPPVMFTVEEAAALFTGARISDHFTDRSLQKEMGSALRKIRAILPGPSQDLVERLQRAVEIVPRALAGDPAPTSEALAPLHRAIAERRVLGIDYRAGSQGRPSTRQVEPLGLVYYSGAWHLIAYCRLRRDYRDFRTSRIQRLTPAAETFPAHPDFSIGDYLRRDRRKARVKTADVLFRRPVVGRVRRGWHWGILEERAHPGGVRFTLAAPTYPWLAEWLLSFGTAAKVESPPSFQRMVARLATAVAQSYS